MGGVDCRNQSCPLIYISTQCRKYSCCGNISNLGNFYQFWAILDNFGHFLAILGNFGQFWAIFGISWQFLDNFLHFLLIFGHFNNIVQGYLSNHIFHTGSANGDAKYIPFGRYMTFMMNILLGTDVNVLVFDGL